MLREFANRSIAKGAGPWGRSCWNSTGAGALADDCLVLTNGKFPHFEQPSPPAFNENSYIADNRDQDAQKRIFRMKFQFKDKKYGKDKQYFFVVYDDATGLEVFRHPVIMDLAFADDYGF